MHIGTLRPLVLLVCPFSYNHIFVHFVPSVQSQPFLLPFLILCSFLGMYFLILWQLSDHLSFTVFALFFSSSPSACSHDYSAFKISLRFPTHDSSPTLQALSLFSHGDACLEHCQRSHLQPCLLTGVFAGHHWACSGGSGACKCSFSS